MTKQKATRPLRQQGRVKGSQTTRSIVSNRETFCLVTWSLLFTIALLAVPTVMAATKQFGWW